MKELEALNYLNQFINEMIYCLEHPKEFAKGYEKQIFWKYKNTFEITIKQALIKSQKNEKVLKVTREKDVDFYSLRICKTLKEYNTEFMIDEYHYLTQEEYELLKEVLE